MKSIKFESRTATAIGATTNIDPSFETTDCIRKQVDDKHITKKSTTGCTLGKLKNTKSRKQKAYVWCYESMRYGLF
ncbi:hypothetical protein L1987_37974 [Smallanthus sonchifolius]|uniref:Uncharacterized protein n=1 Tax=Smallanthus sonchifolius TaxID=185202 RepID=A0ACB9HHE1_9ASTR|nr:hypothetical protein L1987_37974 [Smallanthus sonchifolius]